MKLTEEIKNKIDKYFSEISDEDFVRSLVENNFEVGVNIFTVPVQLTTKEYTSIEPSLFVNAKQSAIYSVSAGAIHKEPITAVRELGASVFIKKTRNSSKATRNLQTAYLQNA